MLTDLRHHPCLLEMERPVSFPGPFLSLTTQSKLLASGACILPLNKVSAADTALSEALQKPNGERH
jgi:hypothetical protein